MKSPRDDGTRTASGTGRLRGLRPPWRPGQSGNPRGGASLLLSLAARIRRASGDGQELVDFFVSVFRGQPIPVPGRRVPVIPRLEHRMHAAAWLADRGWGRARETIEVAGEEPSPAERLRMLRQLSDEERETVRVILQRALDRAAGVDTVAPPSDPSHDSAS